MTLVVLQYWHVACGSPGSTFSLAPQLGQSTATAFATGGMVTSAAPFHNLGSTRYARRVPPDDLDHRAILARRAALIASALTAIGCTPATQPGPEPASSSVVPIPTPPDASAAPPEPPAPAPAPPPPPKAGASPGFDVPAGISEGARDHYTRMHERMKSLYDLLDKAESELPADCSVLQTPCDPRWRAIADHFHAMSGTLTFAYHCPGSSAEAKAFDAHHQAHRAHYDARRAALEARLEQVLAKDGPKGKARWEQMLQDAFAAKPFACLSYGCQDW
jgi:hypothetical protein